jgi:KUP system potassium uptake protein
VTLRPLSVQPRGTASVGALFGPMMLFWFGTLGALGVWNILKHPDVLAAINPWYAAHFFLENRTHAWLALGAVVLAITGGEALYADMGHFGRRSIKWAWLGYVFPCLYLNYLGQGALILDNPSRDQESLLHAGPRRPALPDGRTRHGRHCDRLAGRHLRRVFADQPGDATRATARAYR